VFAVSVIAGVAVAGLRALSLWRALRHFRHRLDAGLGELTARIVGTESRLGAADGRAKELDSSRVSLQDSVTRALVLARAASDAYALVGRVRGFYPSK